MRIVLVESGVKARGGLARLPEARGHELFSFEDGREALAKIAADPDVDAVITSAHTRSMSGVELCWEARLLAGRLRAIYILFIAPTDDEITTAEALDGGADDVIDDAARPIELLAKLRAAERMLTLQRKLVRSATMDPLSGALNRGAFFEEIAEACSLARSGQPGDCLARC